MAVESIVERGGIRDAAAVRSMSGSWHNFFYASFDPAGFVSVDKPPVALWIQVASVKLLGFHWWTVVMPQVLEGLATVALIYAAPVASALLTLLLWLISRGRELASRTLRHLATGATTLAIAALLVLPLAWALSSVLVPGIAVLPSADLSRLGSAYATLARSRVRAQDEILTRQLAAFLLRRRQGERFLVATSSVRLAAPIIIETGEPVMARGGYHGLDPILTPEELARLVDTKQVRFVMLGDLSPSSRRLGGEAAGQPIADWVRTRGRPVDPTLWRPESSSRRLAARIEGVQLYDLRPNPGL